MSKKFKKKRHPLDNKHVHNDDINQLVVCEDIENESEDLDVSLNYGDNKNFNKRERVKQY